MIEVYLDRLESLCSEVESYTSNKYAWETVDKIRRTLLELKTYTDGVEVVLRRLRVNNKNLNNELSDLEAEIEDFL